MVAIIKTGRSIYGALAYNEKKVEQGDAVSLGVVNSLARAIKQALTEKAKMLQDLADRNQRTKRNSVHITLSFAKDDKLDAAQLREITKDYLEGIGFGDQPAYIYRHRDTNNDHIHIVTTNITREGKRIDDSFVGATKSEVIRKKIEESYNLVKAEEQGKAKDTAQRLAKMTAPQGEDRAELRAYARYTIRDTLTAYKPGTIGELNALLKDRDLKVRQEKGQTPGGSDWRGYSIVRTDARTGQENSAAIKASKVFEKGWGVKLEKTLAANAGNATKILGQVKGKVRDAFADGRSSTADMTAALNNNGIRIVHHHTAEGRRFGLHYIDEQSGHVFKASQVGRKFTATEWNRREQTNTLNLEDYQKLMKDAKQYVEEKTNEVGYRSVVIKQLDSRELQFAMVQLGHQGEIIKPYLDEVVAAEKKDYSAALKRDQKQVKDLYWGLVQVQSEFRRPLMDSLALVRKGDNIVLRDNEEITMPAEQLKEGRGVKGLVTGQLSSDERRMLVGVGRYRGIGGIPLDVNVTTVDWKYWEGKFKPGTAKQLGQQLHQNYIKKELTLLDGEGKTGMDQPLLRLASKGILIKPTANGYEAHMAGTEKYVYQVPGYLASKIYRDDYKVEHYEQVKALLDEKIGRESLDAVQRATIKKLRTATGRRRSVPNSLSFELRGYLMSKGSQAKRSGLYKILQSMDEDEKLSWDERKQNRTLRL